MKRKLSTRIAVIETVLVLITITALIAVAATVSTEAVSAGTQGTLRAISKQNSIQIQSMLNEAADAADGLRAYIISNYEGTDVGCGVKTEQSAVYSQNLSPACKAIESLSVETGWHKVGNSQSLVGLGIFFQPYAFDSHIERYAIYIDQAMAAAKTVSAYTEDYTAEAYYQDAVEQNKPVITEPFMWGDIYMVSVAYPIEVDGSVIGAAIADISMDSFRSIKVTDDNYPTMYAGIVSESGTVMFDSKQAGAVGGSFQSLLANADDYAAIAAKFAAGEPFRIETAGNDGQAEIRFFEPIKLSNETWWSQTVVEESDFDSAASDLMIRLVAVAAAAVVLLIAMTYFLLRKELKPIQGMVGSAEKIEHGDLEIDIDLKSENEIGQLARSFKNMAGGLRLIINDISYLLTEMANNNFSARSENQDRYVGEYGVIIQSLRHIKETLNKTLLEIRKASERVSSASDQVSSGAQSLAQGATEQASSVEELSASISEISAQIGEAAKNANTASEITNQVGDVMRISLSGMHQLLAAMSDISTASQNIGKVIKDIDDIAFQTNILALNAAVEAARAGAAGKGFAVVAGEVRNLAQKSSESANNTTALIESVVDAVGKGVALAENANHAFEEVNEKAANVRGLVSEISSAAEAQAESIRQILIGIEQISGVVQMNSATAEESAAASEELSTQAGLLRDLVLKFMLDKESGMS